ncbi:MAG: hypothetical protein RLZZ40_1, partial [Actinomycetota bacterium]
MYYEFMRNTFVRGTATTLSSLFLVLAGTSIAHASPVDDATGYIYHITNTSPTQLNRYNIAEDVDEHVGTTGDSCDFIESGWQIPDFEVDSEHAAVYFLRGVSTWPAADVQSIIRLDLTTGTCETVIEQTTFNENGREAIWRGLTVDSERNLLFFVDNQGFPSKNVSGDVNSVNESL